MDRNLTSTSRLTVYLVDDDPDVLRSLAELLSAAGIRTESHLTAESLLASVAQDSAGCVVSDFKLTGMSGLDLQRELAAAGIFLPLVIVSGYASVPMTVELMENGAVTLLEKPFDSAELLNAVQKALDRFLAEAKQRMELATIRQRLDTLTPEELEVLELMIAGSPNKVISTELEISMRTVDRRRSNVLQKMGVSSPPELARLVTLVEVASHA